jgi:hypothetical protein
MSLIVISWGSEPYFLNSSIIAASALTSGCSPIPSATNGYGRFLQYLEMHASLVDAIEGLVLLIPAASTNEVYLTHGGLICVEAARALE